VIAVKKVEYYYSILSKEHKNIYKLLHTGIESFSDKIDLPALPFDDTEMIFDSVLKDNPLLFHVKSCKIESDSVGTRLFPSYAFTKQTAGKYHTETMRLLHC
jgi:hypothetical protein